MHTGDASGQGAPPLGASRARVLVTLRSAGRPLSVDELAERAGLHPNTIRFHLEALTELGLVRGEVETRASAGRPRTLYEAGPESGQVGVRHYALLAGILAESLSRSVPDGSARARAAGEEWGRSCAGSPEPPVDAAEGSRRLLDMLTSMGCEPVVASDGEAIVMNNCPFKEVADSHPEVVCALHLGILHSVAEVLGAPQEVERLEPRREPGRCLIHLAPPGRV